MKSILQTCLSKRKIDCENFDEYVGFCEICQRKELKDMKCGNKNRPAAVTVKAQRVCAHVRAPMCFKKWIAGHWNVLHPAFPDSVSTIQ